MPSNDIAEQKKLEELRHKNRMTEIAEETNCRKELEQIKFDNQMGLHRLKRRDIMHSIEANKHRG